MIVPRFWRMAKVKRKIATCSFWKSMLILMEKMMTEDLLTAWRICIFFSIVFLLLTLAIFPWSSSWFVFVPSNFTISIRYRSIMFMLSAHACTNILLFENHEEIGMWLVKLWLTNNQTMRKIYFTQQTIWSILHWAVQTLRKHVADLQCRE